MSANKRQLRKRKQTKPQTDEECDFSDEDIDPQKAICKNEQKVEISSAQAELYFEYLRKKISHQANDPFSLPFLNLKFQQLDSSWKGATEQLNLQSRIYGMRVDNCHDNTMKLLNYVIRNQQQQIGKDIGGAQQEVKKENQQNQNQPKSNSNFYLQKPQKLIANIELDTQLCNISLWKVIFKKSQTLSQIQLNTIELSDSLALQIDLKNVKYRPKNQHQKNPHSLILYQIEEDIFQRYPFINQKLQIFKEMEIVKKQVNEELEEILQRKRNNQKNNYENGIQNPLWQMNLGIRDLDFTDFYEEFNEFQRNHENNQDDAELNDDQMFGPHFQHNTREEIFTPKSRELHTIPINPLEQDNSQEQYTDQEDAYQTDLYQPQKDLLFHSTYKKAKKIDNRKFGKIRKTYKTNIDFTSTSLITNRKKVFKHKKPSKNNIRNNNLVPINYVVVYESRNPFKKIKKVPKNSGKSNIYENNQNQRCIQTQQIEKPSQYMQQTMLSQSYYPHEFRQHPQEGQENEEIQLTSKFYKPIPMKTVKNEIMKEIKSGDRSAMLTRPLTMISSMQESSKLDQTSYMDTYLQQQARMIGFKFFKEKMKLYDPLDILVSLLHVAYEEQVRLHPIYLPNKQNPCRTDMTLCDIVIQADHLY